MLPLPTPTRAWQSVYALHTLKTGALVFKSKLSRPGRVRASMFYHLRGADAPKERDDVEGGKATFLFPFLVVDELHSCIAGQ